MFFRFFIVFIHTIFFSYSFDTQAFENISSPICFLFEKKVLDDSLSVNSIIQKAINAAPAHDKSYANYQAETFIQNSGRWTNIPAIWKSLLAVEGVDEGLTYQSESFAKFAVNQSNDYRFEYQAIRNNYHAQEHPDKLVNPNFYKPVLGTGAISPLCPNGFYYYDYQLVKVSELGNIKLFQIKVTPKHFNDEKVFSGTITLTSDDFSLQNIDLNVPIVRCGV